MLFQVAKFISIYDVYRNLCITKQNHPFTIGEDFSKENMLVLYLSTLYSLFDQQKTAQSLRKNEFRDPDVEILRKAIINEWTQIEESVKIIRHCIGFHTAKKIDGQKKASAEFAKLGKKPFKLTNKLIEFYFKSLEKRELTKG